MANKTRWFLTATLPGIPLIFNGFEKVEVNPINLFSYGSVDWSRDADLREFMEGINRLRSTLPGLCLTADYQPLEALTKDEKIKFMVPVHLYGIPLDLVRLKTIKDKFELKIVEDCAQAIGAECDGKMVGSVGQLTAVSFYPTKNLGAIGDGGALLGDGQEEQLASAYRNYGQTARYVHDYLGLNSRLDELQAAILGYLLRNRLKNFTNRRQAIAKNYLKQINQDQIELVRVERSSMPVWHLFPVIVKKDRQKFVDYCSQNGVQTGIHYPVLIPDQKAIRTSKYQVIGQLTQARRFANFEVSIPIHPYLTDAEVAKVIEVINSYT